MIIKHMSIGDIVLVGFLYVVLLEILVFLGTAALICWACDSLIDGVKRVPR